MATDDRSGQLLEPPRATAHEVVRRTLGDSFAGAYSDPDGTLVLLYVEHGVTPAVLHGLRAAGVPVQARRVEHSLDHLQGLQQLIQSTRPFEARFGVKQRTVSVVIQRNSVVVALDQASPEMRQFAAQRFGTAVTVRTASGFSPLHGRSGRSS